MRFGFESPESLAAYRKASNSPINVSAYPKMVYATCCGKMRSPSQKPDADKPCLDCQRKGYGK